MGDQPVRDDGARVGRCFAHLYQEAMDHGGFRTGSGSGALPADDGEGIAVGPLLLSLRLSAFGSSNPKLKSMFFTIRIAGLFNVGNRPF